MAHSLLDRRLIAATMLAVLVGVGGLLLLLLLLRTADAQTATSFALNFDTATNNFNTVGTGTAAAPPTNLAVGDEFMVDVVVEGADDIDGASFDLAYDAFLLELVSVDYSATTAETFRLEGGFDSTGNQTVNAVISVGSEDVITVAGNLRGTIRAILESGRGADGRRSPRPLRVQGEK